MASCTDAPLEHANARSMLKSSPNAPNVCTRLHAGQTTGGTLVTRLLTSRSQFQERVRPGLHPLSLVAVWENDYGDGGQMNLWWSMTLRPLEARHSRTSATDVAARCTSSVRVVPHVQLSECVTIVARFPSNDSRDVSG